MVMIIFIIVFQFSFLVHVIGSEYGGNNPKKETWPVGIQVSMLHIIIKAIQCLVLVCLCFLLPVRNVF